MSTRSLRAETTARDAFLATVARKLEDQVVALGRPRARRELRASIRDLGSFVRELRIIAEPSRPVPLRRRRLDLGRTLVRWLDTMRSAAGDQFFEIATSRGGAASGRWDRDHLHTLFGEMLSNAMKYGGTAPVTIRLLHRKTDVWLVVENSGGWVGPRPRFERFHRGETRANVPGFGVGLWLSRRLARAHGGSFRIITTPNGTRANLALPCDRIAGDLSRFQVTVTRRARGSTSSGTQSGQG